MRAIYVLMAGAALIASSPAWSADELKFGAPAAWIVPQVIPPASDKAKEWTDKAAEKTKEAARNVGKKVERAGEKIKESGKS